MSLQPQVWPGLQAAGTQARCNLSTEHPLARWRQNATPCCHKYKPAFPGPGQGRDIDNPPMQRLTTNTSIIAHAGQRKQGSDNSRQSFPGVQAAEKAEVWAARGQTKLSQQ